ncbi:MAG TPA: hypothetical protein PLV59_02970 [Candidatus Dojkabacteria bacterium]|nr:hypothetical protein [Candidatus Dojkabacteria bacterium]
MTNPFQYYTYVEIATSTGMIIALAISLVLYNTYYLKKRSGVYLISTLISPTLTSLLIFIFADTLRLSVAGFNAVFVAWLPLLFSFCHTVYFVSMLHREKQNIKDDVTFDFLKTIKKETLIFSLYLLVILAATFAILPLNNVIALGVGVGIAILSTLINSVIIVKKI